MGDLSGSDRVADYVYYPVSLTVPAGTPASAPATVQPFTSDKDLISIELQVPPGHSGFTGFSVTYDGTTILPWSTTGAQWIIADNYVKEFDVGMRVGPHMTITGYNTDQFPHTFYVRLKVRNNPPPSAAVTTPPGGAVTQLQPPPTTPTGVPPVSTPLPTTIGVDPNDPVIVALTGRVTAIEQTVETLQAQLAALQQQLNAVVATTPGPNPVPATTPGSVPSTPAPGTGGTPPVPAKELTIPGAPAVTLPPQGQTYQAPGGQVINPYQPNGALDITAVGQIAAAHGGQANVTLPSGAVLPVTSGTLGGHPYTCIGTSC